MIEEPNQAQPVSRATSQEKNEDTPIHFGFVEPSIPAKKIWLGGALSFSILGLWFIYEATFTDAGERWLPYSMDTAQVLVPEARYTEFVRSLTALGAWTAEGQPTALPTDPPQLRFSIRISE